MSWAYQPGHRERAQTIAMLVQSDLLTRSRRSNWSRNAACQRTIKSGCPQREGYQPHVGRRVRCSMTVATSRGRGRLVTAFDGPLEYGQDCLRLDGRESFPLVAVDHGD